MSLRRIRKISQLSLKCDECNNLLTICRKPGKYSNRKQVEMLYCFKCKKITVHKEK